MPLVFRLLAALLAVGIGFVFGFCREWRKGPPPPIAIRWCKPSSTDPACAIALENYERQLAKERYVREFMNPALSSQAAEPPPP
jgi:hypothetical protein